MNVDVMTIPEVARALRISRSSAYLLVAQQQIETVNVGSIRRPRLRVRPDALDRYLQTRVVSRGPTHPPTPSTPAPNPSPPGPGPGRRAA